MTPLWLGAPALAALGLLGYALLSLAGVLRAPAPRSLSRGYSLGDLALCAAAGLAAAYPLWLAPLVALPALALLVFLARRFARASHALAPPRSAPASRVALVALALVLTLFALAQPPTPTYWDEFVWLAKSRLECAHWWGLRAAALDPVRPAIPAGYPLLWSLAAAWFGALRDRPDALTAGASVARLLALALYALALTRLTPRAPRALLTAFALLACTPLALVHLRAAHADLPVGLFTAAGALSLAAALSRRALAPRSFALAAASLAVASGLKDEGAAHALAALLAAALAHRGRLASSQRAALALVSLCAFAPAVLWRALLALSGVRNTDHTLGAPALRHMAPLARSALGSITDLTSWGALPVLTLACGAYLLFDTLFARAPRVSRDRVTAQLSFTLALQASAVALGVALGPEGVREFAREGTLWNRLGMQLVPVACALIARVLDRLVTAPARRSA